MLAVSFARAGAQDDDRRFIQIDGLTADDQGFIVPDVSIYSKHLRRGAASDHRGIYNIFQRHRLQVYPAYHTAINYRESLYHRCHYGY
jgi:hypothetical protein